MRGFSFMALALLLAVAQTTAYHIFWPLSVWPDFILLFTLYTGLRFGRYEGVKFGALMGLLQDLSSYGSSGICMLSKSLIGFAVGYLKERFIKDSIVTRFFLTLLAFVFDISVYAALSRAIIGHDLNAALFETAPAALVLTVGLAIPFYALIDYIDRLYMRKKGGDMNGAPEILPR